MKAIILLGTLKKSGLSNTEVLSEFLASRMKEQGIDCEIIKLVNYNILPGTYSDMGADDEWLKILTKILVSDILIFATPVWWGGHSSEIQKVIERLDEIHDEIMEGKKSRLEGKLGGIIITGDSDGGEHIIGNISNFFNAMGITLYPYTSLSALWNGHAKGAKTSREALIKKYEKEYTQTADTMIAQFKKRK
jgi:multimeric flavodoxin WrbA